MKNYLYCKILSVVIIVLFMGFSVSSATTNIVKHSIINDNQPPSPPDIDAPASIWVKEEVTICLYSVDPEGDNVSFYIEWGDGTSEGWTDYITPGIGFAIRHKWDKVNWDNILRAKTKDIHGNESDWNSLQIPIVKSKDCGCNDSNYKYVYPPIICGILKVMIRLIGPIGDVIGILLIGFGYTKDEVENMLSPVINFYNSIRELWSQLNCPPLYP